MLKEYFICERCNRKFSIDVTRVTKDFELLNDRIKPDGQMNNLYGIICPFCNEMETFHVDRDIADIIISFTRKGYRTLYCCSGHQDVSIWHGLGGNPYISMIAEKRFVDWWMNTWHLSSINWNLELVTKGKYDSDATMILRYRQTYSDGIPQNIIDGAMKELAFICVKCPTINHKNLYGIE